MSRADICEHGSQRRKCPHCESAKLELENLGQSDLIARLEAGNAKLQADLAAAQAALDGLQKGLRWVAEAKDAHGSVLERTFPVLHQAAMDTLAKYATGSTAGLDAAIAKARAEEAEKVTASIAPAIGSEVPGFMEVLVRLCDDHFTDPAGMIAEAVNELIATARAEGAAEAQEALSRIVAELRPARRRSK